MKIKDTIDDLNKEYEVTMSKKELLLVCAMIGKTGGSPKGFRGMIENIGNVIGEEFYPGDDVFYATIEEVLDLKMTGSLHIKN